MNKHNQDKILKNAQNLSQGDKNALSYFTYIAECEDTDILELNIFLTIPTLMHKRIHGRLLGDLWRISERHIYLFTALIKKISHKDVFMLYMLKNIPEDIKLMMEADIQEFKKAGIEEGWYIEEEVYYGK